MGAVYEAWDGELGVSVALKVIRPDMPGDSGIARDLERRFKRELLLARQVTHKNVVRIHDLGEIDGIKYITMPYIEGNDLGSILKAEGPTSGAAGAWRCCGRRCRGWLLRMRQASFTAISSRPTS